MRADNGEVPRGLDELVEVRPVADTVTPDEAARAASEQPPPTVNDSPLVKDAIHADIEELCERRRQKYGTHLQPHNGRDALRDAYEEALDQALYLKQALMERDGC
jgi:hypothetical protein